MNVPPHWFRGSRSTRIPQSWCFFYARAAVERRESGLEIETLDDVAAVVVNRRGTRWKTTAEIHAASQTDWWQWIADVVLAERSCWCYGYRLAQQLTILGLWRRMERAEYGLRDPRPQRPSRANPLKIAQPRDGLAVLTDPPTILVLWHRSGRQLRLVDSLNVFPLQWDDFAGLVDVEQHQAGEQGSHVGSEIMTSRQRVEVIRRVIQTAAEEWQGRQLGSWRASLSGMAASSYRRTIRRPTILIDDDACSRAICREAYYGGETRAFRTGLIDGPVYEVDLASAYSWAMSARPHPCKLLQVVRRPSVRQLGLLASSTWSAAIVLLDTPERGYSVRRGDEVRQTRGTFWTALCGEELTDALDHDLVQECEVAAVYACQDVFSAWCEMWWSIRQEAERDGNRVLALLGKTIPCAFYGRWAMRSGTWQDRPGHAATVPWGHWHEIHPERGTVAEYRSLGGWVQERCDPVDAADTLPALSASITATVRVRMRQLVDQAGADNVHWQAVDCLWINAEGLRRLKMADCLAEGRRGYMRQHGAYKWVRIFGPHAVETDRDLRIVGLRPEHVRLGPDLFRQRIGPGLGTLLRGVGPEQYTTACAEYQLAAWNAVGPINEMGTIGLPQLIDNRIPIRLIKLLRPENVAENDADKQNQNGGLAS